MAATPASNFSFLQEHDPIFFQLATGAERAFSADPNTTLIKLRQLGEAIAQDLATRCSIEFDSQMNQAALLHRLHQELRLDPQIKNVFHALRIEGNKATHQFRTRHKEALDGLKLARALCIWFHKSFGNNPSFKAGAFVSPKDPSQDLRALQTEIDQLKTQLTDASGELEASQHLSDLTAKEKAEYEALAGLMDQEARQYAEQVRQQEVQLKQERDDFEKRIKTLQDQLNDQPATDVRSPSKARTQPATMAALALNEELTRILIDQHLIEAGWEADTEELTHAKGARPEKDKNKAIAEWPTQGRQAADYVLFAGLTPIAVVEAKRENENVAGKIPQAERYARGLPVIAPMIAAWELEKRTIAWPDDNEGHFVIPFVYSCNGRPYVKQLAEQSGTWFRDVRSTGNTRKPLQQFHTPAGLLDLLNRDREVAQKKLDAEPFGYLGLRDYQEKAISAVERALEQGRQHCLLAMATGTGKTRTIIGLMYRLLKTERFRRILFLVDRTALGEQAMGAFDEAPLEKSMPLSKIYNVAELEDQAAEAETRIQVATVQAMVQRIFNNDEPPPIDSYDCIIIDEAHRGYTLDQDMTDGELENRDPAQYLSSYRRVLDYFDAVQVGLTATPARHTSEIFGKPIFSYSYREAVADDWLIDHEPPIRYLTKLSENGIHFDKGEAVSAIDIQTGQVEMAELDDELNFEIESFNRRVITPEFNKIICQQLAHEIDPFGDEKTLIFCATDLHADMVKNLLDETFADLYNGEYNEAAVRKITGKSDRVRQLIRRFKNERYPSIAITVDLLSTGIDVPAICHLVFLRRVRSRILFEQMLGRATRRCDDIGKTVFHIYDPVDIYKALENVTDMKPLVKDPSITLEQLVNELTDEDHLTRAMESPGERPDTSHADDILDQVSQKLMRVLRKAEKKAEKKPAVQTRLQHLEDLWGVPPKKLHQHLQQLGPRRAADFVRDHNGLLHQLHEVQALLGSDHAPLIYEGEDEFRDRRQDHGVHERPGDYLEEFNAFIREQVNESAAIAAVVNRPRDLTRQQLREIRLQLDNAGFSEANLRSAWKGKTNQEMAASVIGFIRQAALGEPMVPFEDRVRNAMQRVLSDHNWTPVQKRWLNRLATQLTHEIVVDKAFINERFATHGGLKQLDRVLDHHLDEVLESLNDELWKPPAAHGQ